MQFKWIRGIPDDDKVEEWKDVEVAVMFTSKDRSYSAEFYDSTMSLGSSENRDSFMEVDDTNSLGEDYCDKGCVYS